MSRMGAALACDVRLQSRNGFYHAAAFVALCYVIALKQFSNADLTWLMPVLVLSNLSINTFYFVAGLVLLEKGEGTLTALVVTPLRSREYLASKVATLTLLTILENVAIVLVGYGMTFNAVLLLGGIGLASPMLVLTGFLLVSRYDSINEFLFPSAFYSLGFLPPFLQYFGFLESWLFYLHPLQAPLLLMKGAFVEIATWQWAYGFLYGGVWVLLLLGLSERVFTRFATAAEGAV